MAVESLIKSRYGHLYKQNGRHTPEPVIAVPSGSNDRGESDLSIFVPPTLPEHANLNTSLRNVATAPQFPRSNGRAAIHPEFGRSALEQQAKPISQPIPRVRVTFSSSPSLLPKARERPVSPRSKKHTPGIMDRVLNKVFSTIDNLGNAADHFIENTLPDSIDDWGQRNDEKLLNFISSQRKKIPPITQNLTQTKSSARQKWQAFTDFCRDFWEDQSTDFIYSVRSIQEKTDDWIFSLRKDKNKPTAGLERLNEAASGPSTKIEIRSQKNPVLIISESLQLQESTESRPKTILYQVNNLVKAKTSLKTLDFTRIIIDVRGFLNINDAMAFARNLTQEHQMDPASILIITSEARTNYKSDYTSQQASRNYPAAQLLDYGGFIICNLQNIPFIQSFAWGENPPYYIDPQLNVAHDEYGARTESHAAHIKQH